MRKYHWGRFTPVMLHYILIPWCRGPDGSRVGLMHPYALILHDKSYPGTKHTYENRLHNLLDELGLWGCDFRQSLLQPGTTPLPECLLDWFAGIPSKSAALPYYAPNTRDAATQTEKCIFLGGGGR